MQGGVRGLTFSSSKTSAALRYCKTSKVSTSSILWNGRSFAASVASHSPEEPIKPYKRVSRDERRKSIIDFVDKYRASNAGKFPSVSASQKQVGGSHYTVKNIIQELQYKSKQASTIPTKIEENSLEDEHISLLKTPDVSSSKNGADLTCSARSLERKKESHTLVIDNKDAEQPTSSSAEVKEETLSSTSVLFSEAALNHQQIGEPSSFDQTHSDQIKLERKEVTVLSKDEVKNIKNVSSSDGSMDLNEPKVVQENGEEPSSESDIMQGDLSNLDKTHSDQLNLKRMEVSLPPNDEPETSNEAASSDGSLDLNKPKVLQDNGQEASELDKLQRSELPRDTSIKENEGKESAYKSSVWGSLRSFADGIINLWKKK